MKQQQQQQKMNHEDKDPNPTLTINERYSSCVQEHSDDGVAISGVWEQSRMFSACLFKFRLTDTLLEMASD